MTVHSLATVLIPFEAGKKADDETDNIARVDTAIGAWNAEGKGSVKARLDDTGVIHFASVSTVKISDEKATMIIEISADVPGPESLRIVAGLLKNEIVLLLTAAAIKPPSELEPWLLARSVRIGQLPFVVCGLLFDGSPGMTVRRISAEAKLVETLETNLSWLGGNGSSAQKLAKIRKELWPDGDFKPGFVPQPTPILDPAPPSKTFLEKLWLYAILAYRLLIWPSPLLTVLFLLFALLPYHGHALAHLGIALLDSALVLGIAFGALTAVVRWHEIHDVIPERIQKQRDAEAILARENETSQNILATESVLKDGLARRLTLQLVFYVIRTMLPLYWAPGRLGDLNDIHFMRWLLLPGTKTLVFRSHYDGSWVNYIEDFALRAPQGVSAIWSNTLGFPRTQWLTQDGAANGPRFRRWVHTQTRPVPFTYSAYPRLSMERIRLNARIAHAIATGKADKGVEDWLVSLGDASGGDF